MVEETGAAAAAAWSEMETGLPNFWKSVCDSNNSHLRTIMIFFAVNVVANVMSEANKGALVELISHGIELRGQHSNREEVAVRHG